MLHRGGREKGEGRTDNYGHNGHPIYLFSGRSVFLILSRCHLLDIHRNNLRDKAACRAFAYPFEGSEAVDFGQGEGRREGVVDGAEFEG